jgi:hypothetical protein
MTPFPLQVINFKLANHPPSPLRRNSIHGPPYLGLRWPWPQGMESLVNELCFAAYRPYPLKGIGWALLGQTLLTFKNLLNQITTN